ncbi:hypothetical protein Tco_1305574, partial [Tanacetum coccineum]
MMPEYDHEDLTINSTQVFSVHNWALKPNQTEGPPFTAHMLAICKLDMPFTNKAPNTSSHDEIKDSRDLIQPFSKEAAHSPTGHSKNKKNFSTAKDKAPSQPLVSTPVDTELHKEDLQAAGDPTFLGVASEEGAHPQLSSGCDASTDFTAEADPGKSAPNDPIPSQQGMDEGTKNYLIDHIYFISIWLEYGVLVFPGYGVLDLVSFVDKAPSQPLVSTPVDTELHKEDLQAAGDPTFLGVASKEGAVYFTAEADPGKSAPNDPIPSQQGMDEGTKNYL